VSVVESDNTLRAVESRVVSQRQPTWALGFHISESKVLLGAGDLLCINVALALALGWRFGHPLGELLGMQPSWFVALTGVWLGVALLLGSYDLRPTARLRAGATIGAATSLVTAVVYLLIPYLSLIHI